MTKIALVTDSTCDLPPEIVAARGIEITPQHILWGTQTYTDGIDMTNVMFYERLARDAELPKTSQPSAGDFADKYRMARDKIKADAVVCVTVSSRLSGTHGSAIAARDLVDFPVHVVDSRTASIALGFVVLAAADARDRGASVEEVVNAAQQAAQRGQMLFTLNTLEFLHRGGRIGGARRLIGTALSIKPILHIKDGAVEALESVRTRKRAIARLVELGVKYKDQGSAPLWVGLLHTTAPELEEFEQELKAALKPDLFTRSMACSAVGVHTGPGALGIGITRGTA